MAESLLRQMSTDREIDEAIISRGELGSILRARVDSMQYRVSLDILEFIFLRFGPLKKIVVFELNRGEILQVYIQFADAKSANRAQKETNDRNIYNEGCKMNVIQSNLTDIWVKGADYRSYELTALESRNESPGATQEKGELYAMICEKEKPLTELRMMCELKTVQEAEVVSELENESNNPKMLFATNLDREKVTPDALFNLFGAYGEVYRVKILFEKRHSALVQMAESNQAKTALNHLDKIRIWNREIRVMFSKHSIIKLNKKGSPDNEFTRDYSKKGLHRSKSTDGEAYGLIYSPSKNLQLSNIPSNVSGMTIREKFADNGFEAIGFKFFEGYREMALIKFQSKEIATMALMKMHNRKLSDSNRLRVSFTALKF